MLSYKLFSDGRALLTNRLPELAGDTVAFFFDGACDGCTLILENAREEKLYRRLSSGRAEAPAAFLVGKVSVAVASLKESSSVSWKCESLVCERRGGALFVMPAAMELQGELVAARCEVERLRAELAKLRTEHAAIRAELEACLAGYDVL